MGVIYTDYSRARIGWFFGLSGWQLATVALSVAAGRSGRCSRRRGRRWPLFALLWACRRAGHGDPGPGPVGDRLGRRVAVVRGRRAWPGGPGSGRKPPRGEADSLEEPDLPGVLQGVRIHDGPPRGATFTPGRDHPEPRRPDVGGDRGGDPPRHRDGASSTSGDRQGQGLGELLDVAARTELIDEIAVPGAHRPRGRRRTRPVDRPAPPRQPVRPCARQVNDELRQTLTAGQRAHRGVRHRRRPRGPARPGGQGVRRRPRRPRPGAVRPDGEVEAQLRGGLGMTSVAWLTSPELALACRTGFAPGDRAGIIDALAARPRDPGVNARRAVGDGRPVRGGPGRAALQPRRVELGLRHRQAARPGAP